MNPYYVALKLILKERVGAAKGYFTLIFWVKETPISSSSSYYIKYEFIPKILVIKKGWKNLTIFLIRMRV